MNDEDTPSQAQKDPSFNFKEVAARTEAASRKFLQGDPGPFLDLFSQSDDITVFGGEGGLFQGREAVTRQLKLLAQHATSEILEITYLASHANGHIGYTIGTQRTRLGDGRVATLRVTHIYRFEQGEWRLVHRHGDPNADVNLSGIAAPRQERAEK